ncbi:MAG: pilus assembly protein [Planctomycetaceae bacterium]|nr:pilus assembly protein [Planctomycetaceae bacterium]
MQLTCGTRVKCIHLNSNNKRSQTTWRIGAKRHGAAMVETALALPVMLLIILGVVEFGRAFMVCQLLTNSVREGDRQAVMAGSTTADIRAEVQLLVHNTVGVNSDDVAVEITVTPHTSNKTTTAEHSDLSIAQKRDLCSIRVTVPYDKVSLMPVKWLTGVNLTGQAAMRHE